MLHWEPVPEAASALPSALARWEEILALLAAPGGALFLDYDGTLAPIAPRPDLAVLDGSQRVLLADLARRVPVAIVSGRDRAELEDLVRAPDVTYAGCHGLDMDGAPAVPGADELGRARAALAARLGGVPGLLLEAKRFGLAVHTRRVAAERVPEVEQAVAEVLAGCHGLRAMRGRKVLELRPDVDWDKGRAVERLLRALGIVPADARPVYIGDDLTDEDAFRAVAGRGAGILVGAPRRPTAATFQLAHPPQVTELLRLLHAHLEEPRG